jgi:hypothetical protein
MSKGSGRTKREGRPPFVTGRNAMTSSMSPSKRAEAIDRDIPTATSDKPVSSGYAPGPSLRP